MNRTLRRPMFRMGGAAEGLTSGLSRQGYERGRVVNPGGYQGDIPPGVRSRLYEDQATGARDEGAGTKPSPMETLSFQKSMIEALAPRQPRKDRSMRDFLIDFGLDIASRPPSGGIFATAAASAKDPFARFQQAKQRETAYGMSETSEDRALLAQLIKGMDEDKLSALMKNVKAGVESGLFPDEATGIKLLLQKQIYGVLDMPGELDLRRINELEKDVKIEDSKSFAYARKVAEHIHKWQTGGYPDEITNELVEYPSYVKPRHWSKVVKPKVNEDGEIISFVVDGNWATTYKKGMYFEPKTGNIFKMVSKQGEAPVFVRVEFDQ